MIPVTCFTFPGLVPDPLWGRGTCVDHFREYLKLPDLKFYDT